MRKSTDDTKSAKETANDDATYGAEIQKFHYSLVEIENYRDITVPDIYKWLTNPIQEVELLNNDEIIDMISHDNEDNDDTEIDSSIMSEISSDEANNAINKVIQYCDQNGNYSKDDIITLYRIKDSIICKAIIQ